MSNEMSILRDCMVGYLPMVHRIPLANAIKAAGFNLTAQPMQPAGGEVEVLRYYLDATDGQKPTMVRDPHGYYCAHDHVTRLTAERDELRRQVQLLNEAGEFLDDVSQGIEDQLRAQNVELQAELTKARELIADMVAQQVSAGTDYTADVGRAKAFIACNVDESCGQNAPAAEGESDE